MIISMASILIDADALIALAKIDDLNHQKAIHTGQRYQDHEICITPFTIPEVVTVLSHKVSQAAAKKYLKESQILQWQLLDLTQNIVNDTHELFMAQTKKGTSWVDCLNCIMVKTYRLDGIFSFDRFYRRQHLPLIK